MIDWDKPIQHRNGDLCKLLSTRPEGFNQFNSRPDGSYPTREIYRFGVEDGTEGGLYSAYWYYHEDGKCGLSQYDIINRPE